MPLSGDQFREILASLKSDTPTRGGYEKRTAPRVGLRTKLVIYLDGDLKRSQSIWLRDLSANGIGIVRPHPLEAGSEFLVQFPLRGKEAISAFYRVMHCKDLSKNLYFIGARLDRLAE